MGFLGGKKKQDEDSIEITGPDGKVTVVPRGDLNDEQWGALKEQFFQPSTEQDQKALENRVAPENDALAAKKKAATNEANTANADFAAQRDAGTQESRAAGGALKAADVGAAHTAATDHTGEDFIEVKGANGQKVTVMRGPLSDEEWTKQVQQAKDNGRLINAVETVPTQQDKVGGGTGGTKAGIVNSMAAKLAEGGYQQGADYGKKMAAAADPDQADTSAAAKGKAAGQAVGNIDDLLGGEATKPDSTQPAGKPAAKDRMLSAFRKDASAPADVPEGPTLSREVDPGLQQLQGQKTDLMNADLPQDPLPGASTWDKVRGVAGPALSALGNVPAMGAPFKMLGDAITPPPGPPAIDPALLAASQKAGAWTPETSPSLQGGRAIPGAQGGAFGGALPPGGSAGGSAKMSVSGGPGGLKMPVMPDRQAETDAAYANADAARMANAEAQAKGFKDQADVVRQGMNEQRDLQIETLKSQQKQQQIMEDGAKAYQATLAQLSEPAKVDPDHWWNSRSTAQKIFAVLSAGLTKGATLGMFQHAIDRDVAAQEADISNKRQFLGMKAAGQLNGMQIARQNGLDLFESQKANKAYAWDQIDRQAKMAALNTSSEVVKTNATEISAIAQQQKLKEETAADQHRQLMALEGVKIDQQERHNKSMEGAAWTKANAGPKAKPGKALEPAIKEKLIASQEGVQAVDRMMGMLGKESSVLDAASDEVAKRINPKSSAARRDKAVELEKRSLERLIDNSAVQKADAEFYKNKLGGVGFDNMTQDDLKNLRKKFKQSLEATIDVNRRAGSNVSGFGGEPELSDEETAAQLGFQGE